MNKDVKVMLKEAAILTVITLLSGFLLGFVNELTANPRQIQHDMAVTNACLAVFPGGSDGISFEEVAYEASDEVKEVITDNKVVIGTVYQALDQNKNSMGYVIESTSKAGFGGSIVIYCGITNDGTLNGVSILSISETPGLGMQAESVLVPQFAGKTAEQFTYTKTGSTSDSEIDAISGATITTKAFTNAVNGSLLAYKDLKGGQ